VDKPQDPSDSFIADEIELDRFVESNLWHDFGIVLSRRRTAVMNDMRNAALTLEQLRFLQGELNGIEFWQKLPVELKKERDRFEEMKQKTEEKQK
jgi:GMP synthase PP-ATPase subunit